MRSQRIQSIDLLRGIVIVIMALDHVRDFWGPTTYMPEDLTQASPGLFFTRWITHFCAPVFVFLAGTSAWLYGSKVNSKQELCRFLLTRGLWLILLELVIVNFSWQWSYSFLFVQVIWALGWSMIFLGIMVWTPSWVIASVAGLMIFGHNALDGIQPQQFGSLGPLWNVLHVPGWIPLTQGGFGVWVAYPLVPWLGVILAGYLFGQVLQLPEQQRNRTMLGLGMVITAAFILLRALSIYGDPGSWQPSDKSVFYQLMAFLNTTKYPPSLIFLCMTLGPALMILPWLEKLRGLPAKVLLVFGQVPLFFYLIHFPIIHLLADIRNYLQYGQTFNLMTQSSTWPETYTMELWVVYLAWISIVFLLYWPCAWYRRYKQQSGNPWLSYL